MKENDLCYLIANDEQLEVLSEVSIDLNKTENF